jgi:hypothetical protein
MMYRDFVGARFAHDVESGAEFGTISGKIVPHYPEASRIAQLLPEPPGNENGMK